MLARSIGRRVPSEWVAKEFKFKGQLQYDSKPFALAKDHHLVRFWSEEDCRKVLDRGPWFAIGQLLAVEPWVPDPLINDDDDARNKTKMGEEK